MDEMEVENGNVQDSKNVFETQLEESLKEFNAPQAGQLVEGTVVSVANDYVYVDIGDKSEGLIPVQEFSGELPKEGDVVQALLTGHNHNGPVLSAFLPISQSDADKVEKPESLLGVKSKFYIERLYSDGKLNPVVNRRKYLEEQINSKRDEFFNTAKIGD